MSPVSRNVLLAVLALALTAACQPLQSAETAEGPDAGGNEVAAVIEGETISVGELDEYVKEKLFREKTENGNPSMVYEVRRSALTELIRERVVAARAARENLTPEQLVERETESLGPVTDEEIQAFYDANRARAGDRTLEDLGPAIRRYLEGERESQAVAAIIESADVEIAIDAPRLDVATDGPALGPEDARITIVEFSDFQCPFCMRASSVVKELRERYPKDVRLVYKHYPLPNHPQAFGAAEASMCAADQDRFWEYHDVLFENARQLQEENLLRFAREMELDMAKFEPCLKERKHRAQVEADLAHGQEVGVSGTPAFFVNGISLVGAQPVESFAEIIDSELERLGGESS